MELTATNYSLYIHIPFCRRRCSYCDFNTYAGSEALLPAYLDALNKEISIIGKSAPQPVNIHTVYFGGGTPSLVSPQDIITILQNTNRSFNLSPGAEITLEANPGTIDRLYLQKLRASGVNRLSMGMQSAHPQDLHLLHRLHDYPDVIQMVKYSRQAGFQNINLDLIFGIPYQTMQRWQTTVEMALGLHPEHLSLYALTIEDETPIKSWINRGLIPPPDDDLAGDMYEWAENRLEKSDFIQYEISNWAHRKGNDQNFACLHNLQYWHNKPYLGFGAGAHGYAQGLRLENVHSIREYTRSLQEAGPTVFPISPATLNISPVDRWTEIEETMMVGLRLTQEGISRNIFKTRFGQVPEQLFKSEINDLLRKGLLTYSGDNNDNLRLTPRGRLLGNQVFMRFIGLHSPETPG